MGIQGKFGLSSALLSLVISFGCDSQAPTATQPTGKTNTTSSKTPSGNNKVDQMVSQVETSLQGAGISDSAAATIADGGAQKAKSASLNLADDDGLSDIEEAQDLAPDVVAGAMDAIDQTDLEGQDAAVAAQTILEACMKALGDLNLLPEDAAAQGDLLGDLVKQAIGSLDEAGFSDAELQDLAAALTEEATKNAAAAGVSADDLAAVIKQIEADAIAGLQDAGLDPAAIEAALPAIIDGAMTGLKDLGLDQAQLEELLKQAGAGMLDGLNNAGIPAEQMDEFAKILMGEMTGSFGDAGLPPEALGDFADDFFKALMDGASQAGADGSFDVDALQKEMETAMMDQLAASGLDQATIDQINQEIAAWQDQAQQQGGFDNGETVISDEDIMGTFP